MEFKDMGSSSPVRTPKSQLDAEQPLTGECWIPPKKDTPCPRAKEKSNKVVGGAKSCLESNRIPIRVAWRAQTKLCTHEDAGAPQEAQPDLPLSVK